MAGFIHSNDSETSGVPLFDDRVMEEVEDTEEDDDEEEEEDVPLDGVLVCFWRLMFESCLGETIESGFRLVLLTLAELEFEELDVGDDEEINDDELDDSDEDRS